MKQKIDINRAFKTAGKDAGLILLPLSEIDESLPQIESDEEVAEELLRACCLRPLDTDGVERQPF
jgi:hypothetical protein